MKNFALKWDPLGEYGWNSCGVGKVPINPEYVQAIHDGIVELRNFEDRAYVYPSGTKMPDEYKV